VQSRSDTSVVRRRKTRKSVVRELGSKYFGRSVKKWRLIACLSQEELAERAGISVSLLGTVERERGYFSTETLCNLSLGLESALGRPMLESLLADSLAALWKESLAAEAQMRERRGLPAASYEGSVTEEDMERASDEVYRALRKWSLLCGRVLGKGRIQGWLLGDPNEFDPQAPPRGADIGRVRIRKAKGAPVTRARS
jgi:transcriptional regulator with XRE-family HTH domain